MALPVTITNTNPPNSASPGLGAQEIRALAQVFLDLFGIPNATAISGAILSLGANVDGKVATLPVAKGATPFLRLIGTEASAIDTRLVESGGTLQTQRNSGTEGTPTWAPQFGFGVAGTPAFLGTLLHQNTAARQWTFPDRDLTVDAFEAGTKIPFYQGTAPLGWTRVVDAANTGAVLIVRLNSESPTTGGTWTFPTHVHATPITKNGGGGPVGVDAHFGTLASGLTSTHSYVDNGAVAAGDVLLTSAVAATDGIWRPAFCELIVAAKD